MDPGKHFSDSQNPCLDTKHDYIGIKMGWNRNSHGRWRQKRAWPKSRCSPHFQILIPSKIDLSPSNYPQSVENCCRPKNAYGSCAGYSSIGNKCTIFELILGDFTEMFCFLKKDRTFKRHKHLLTGKIYPLK